MPECVSCKQEISEEQYRQFHKRGPSCFSTYELEKSKKWIRGGIIEIVVGIIFGTTLPVLGFLGGVLIVPIIFGICGGIMVLEGLIRLIRGILKKQKYTKNQPTSSMTKQ
ncbi:MAG: hypothetical protein GF308_03260 [Candidatus Heimdallarchaeota archaeon]|nr:hypothetical protein [Candidatus Heimdallarchaeota archaeon]